MKTDWKAIRRSNDLWCGLIFVALGLAAVFFMRGLPMGTAVRMGPAYYPTGLGVLLALIGAIVMLRSMIRPGPPVGRLAFGKLALVLGSTLLFGLLLRRAGFIVSLMLLVILSALASPRFRWPAALALAAGLALGSSILFVRCLGLPIPILGPWLGG
ncbi:MAG: tripartite tricarboxylate transporter TctB family protein [Thermodesulfobacteriota bacterium]